MEIEFTHALLIIGALLAVAAALSGWLHGTVLSISVLSVATGIALSALGVVTVDPRDEAIIPVIELALLLTLFSDGLIVERELVSTHWRPPARALLVALPVTLVLLALGARLLFPDLSWAEVFLLGAVLAPTDPVVTSTVVSSTRVPQLVRHTLNLESGLNDGLALPLVLILLVLATTGEAPGEAALDQVIETVGGAAIGLVVAFVGGRSLKYLPGGGITRSYEGVYALGLALLAFAAAEVAHGNGLIAAFVAGMALAFLVPEMPDAFSHFNEDVSAIFQLITFFIFGALIVATSYDGSVLPLVAFIVFALIVARPAAVFLAFAGSALPRAQTLFVAWFGPKGVASMLFALFVLSSGLSDRTLLFEVASFVILASIVAHGLTDTVGAKWIERHLERQSQAPGRR